MILATPEPVWQLEPVTVKGTPLQAVVGPVTVITRGLGLTSYVTAAGAEVPEPSVHVAYTVS